MTKINVKIYSNLLSLKHPGWWHEITVDDKSVGRMTSQKEIKLSPGRHTIKSSNLAGDSNTYEFDIDEGKTKNLEIYVRNTNTVLIKVAILLIPYMTIIALFALHYLAPMTGAVSALVVLLLSMLPAFALFRKDFMVIDEKNG
jgi:hypothetical protein